VISIKSLDAEEISDKSIRIGTDGYINLPLIGRLKVSGLTIEQMEAELIQRLKKFYLRPDVSVSLMDLRSQPVSIIGAVKSPGVQQVQGHTTLVEVLSQAGGVREDGGSNVKITRQKELGPIPLPGCTKDPTGDFYVAEVNIREIIDAKNPVKNIEVRPHDIITVPKADIVYVIGEVKKAGGFVMSERDHFSVLQVLSLAGGLERTAAATKSKILRADGSNRTEIAVDAKKILAGKAKDIDLLPEDILFIPGSNAKNIALRSVETIIPIAATAAIYRY
jgi:polysaccharide export outer membrane protein